MFNTRFLLVATLAVLVSEATARLWWDSTRTRSFQGDFVSFEDEVVHIEGLGGKQFKVPLKRLHMEDQKWVKAHVQERLKEQEALAKQPSLFANLRFGDSVKTVTDKLSESPLVTSGLAKNLSSRTGLNGIFRTKGHIGTGPCSLFFDWDNKEKLIEFTLRTQEFHRSDYDSEVKDSWNQMIETVGNQFGKPAVSNPFPHQKSMIEGTAINTHVWRLPEGITLLIGVGTSEGKHLVSARFTTQAVTVAQ